MKKNIILFTLLFCSLIACQKNQPLLPQAAEPASRVQSLSLAEVKGWYQLQAADSSLKKNSVNTAMKPFNIRSLAIDLDKAQMVITGKHGNWWVTSIPPSTGQNNAYFGYRKLAVMRDSVGQIKGQILEIIPDVIYYQRKQKAETKDFTGRVFIYNLAHQLTGGYLYSQGKIIGQIKPKLNNSTADHKLQTMMVAVSVDCEWYDSSYIDSEGVFTVYSENICSYSIYDDGMGGGGGGGDGGGAPAGGDYLGGGGGGGGAATSSPPVSNLPGEDHPKVNPKTLTDCFGTVPNTNVSMKVTVYVQEPFPGTSFNYGPNSVGHTAIGITKSGGGQTVTQVVGFYPDASGKDKMHAPGKLVDNTNLNYNVSITYNVDAVQFANLINYINSPLPAYDITEMNCTGYAFNACQYAGISLPNPYTTVGMPYPDGTQAQAMTPAGLGNSIENMSGKPGVNTNGGTGPATHGPCN